MVESIGAVVRLLAELVAMTLRPTAEAAAAALRPFVELAAAPFAVTPATEPGALALAAAALTALALLAVALASLSLSPARTIATAPHPRRAIGDDTRLTETHPDAPGHSRPRAPGAAALAA